MRSTTFIIHQCWSDFSSADTLFKDIIGIILRCNSSDFSVFDYDLSLRVHPHLKLRSLFSVLWNEQVTKLSFINFDHIAGQLNIELSHISDQAEELSDGPGRESRHLLITLDSECFTWTCLTIGEDANIITVNCTLDQSLCFIEHFLLSWFWAKDAIKVIGIVDSTSNRQRELIINFDTHFVFSSIFLFRSWEWPDSAVYSNLTFQVFQLVKESLSLNLFFLELLGNAFQLCLHCFVFLG